MSSARLACPSLLVGLLLTAGCPGGDDAPEPLFPPDYATTYTEVRDCRGSGDHDLNNIRVLASPDAAGPYQDRTSPFPVGAIVMKEEHDFADNDCVGEVVQWTVMQRLADGEEPATHLGWRWQKVDLDGNVQSQDDNRCYDCHSMCGVPPDGYLGTCTIPP